MQNFGYSYDIFANLAARKDNNRNLEETFTYDHLNRLTDVWLNNVHTGHMAYDALGRMTDKRTDGQQVFSSAQHDYVGPDGQLRPHAISSATVEDNPFPTTQQSITYTMFDKVGTITQPYNNGLYTLSYAYGYNHQRRRIVENYGNAVFRKKIYGDHCEFVTENSYNSSSTFLTGPLGVFAVVEKKNGSDRLHYVYKDHLGSWTMITDARGNIEQEVSFDAWGNLRDPETWSGEYNGTLMFDRGFTGHEHLMFGQLINMNGRMYDPVMSSFLSVDNYVQAPDFSQSFNRYAYCLNNPLKYTDPTGEKWWHWALADVLSGGFLSSTALVTAEFAFTTAATTSMTFLPMRLANSNECYEMQKLISPVAFKFNYGFGSTNHFGVDVSLGLPGAPSYRWHCGASYYFGKNVYGNYNGWETRTGSEISILPLASFSGTKFKAGEKTQITNKMSVLIAPNFRVTYENDYMFDIPLLGHYNADNGDRWRTAAVRLDVGPISIGTNMYTGDPGWHGGVDGDRITEPINGYDTYVIGKNGDDPDEYRAGVLYVGFGSIKLGWNSEGIRNCFQNELIHKPLGYPYFKVLDTKPGFFFYYGTGTGNTLW